MESTNHRPFVDFYTNLNVIPTTQDISDRDAHFSRRSSLYRSLGIVPLLLNNHSILEFGPGSGHNALVTASMEPSRYVLVDANKKSLESSREVLKEFADTIEFVDSDILSFDSEERFDLVLCEGVIPTQHDPVNFLKHVARFVQSGGILVFTCMDSVSVLAEILRRYQAWHVAPSSMEVAKRIDILTKFFGPHLDTLKVMSRNRADWVIDQIIHPWSGPLFSMADAFEALEGDYVPLGSSPHFLQDWRWYKQFVGGELRSMAPALESYWRNVHSFLDYREVLPPAKEEDNRALEQLADCVYRRVFANERGTSPYLSEDLSADLFAIATQLPSTSKARKGLEAFRYGLQEFKRSGIWPSLPDFESMWGRGQQYVSLVRL